MEGKGNKERGWARAWGRSSRGREECWETSGSRPELLWLDYKWLLAAGLLEEQEAIILDTTGKTQDRLGRAKLLSSVSWNKIRIGWCDLIVLRVGLHIKCQFRYSLLFKCVLFLSVLLISSFIFLMETWMGVHYRLSEII